MDQHQATDTPFAVHQSHRGFVGGLWDEIGDLQFRFLVAQGLTPRDCFIDIGCGSLRGGSRLIPYLRPAGYHGLDKHIELIIYGVNAELGIATFRERTPRFVVSDSFEFEKFEPRGRFTFGIAQSLFTHLAAADIERCLTKLAPQAAPRCRIFATFKESDAPHANPEQSHSHTEFRYTRAEMEAFGAGAWKAQYIGEWGHPRGQRMVEYVRRVP